MVEGCDYSLTFDIHRITPGCKNGEYIIGNMYAICPNHHAEVTRSLIYLEKIDDQTLRVSNAVGDGTPLELERAI